MFAPALLEILPTAQLLMWQPALKGATHLQQFLRLGLAANLFGPGKSATGEPSLAQRLSAGATVEVAGYELPPAVANGLQDATFRAADGAARQVAWFDVVMNDETAVSPATLRNVEALRADGWQVQLTQVIGPPFWQTAEVVEVEALLQQSVASMAMEPAHPNTGHAHAA